jgi:hypothetical protein
VSELLLSLTITINKQAEGVQQPPLSGQELWEIFLEKMELHMVSASSSEAKLDWGVEPGAPVGHQSRGTLAGHNKGTCSPYGSGPSTHYDDFECSGANEAPSKDIGQAVKISHHVLATKDLRDVPVQSITSMKSVLGRVRLPTATVNRILWLLLTLRPALILFKWIVDVPTRKQCCRLWGTLYLPAFASRRLGTWDPLLPAKTGLNYESTLSWTPMKPPSI